MKILMKQIDERNEEIVDTLTSLGISRPVARILSYLKNRNEITSAELERETGLHQPEVSIAARDLREYGWIREREEKRPGKGRPYKIYSLKVGFDKIVDEIERQQRKAANEARMRIERLMESRRY